MSDEIWKLGVCETVASIREGKYTCYEIVQSAIDRLHAVNPGLNAVTVDLSKDALEQAVEIDPKFADAWRSLAEQYSVAGFEEKSQRAYDSHLSATARHPEIIEAANFLFKGKLNKAEELTRKVLKEHPTDVTAIRILADIGIKVGHLEDAQNLLERCLELAPKFHLARHNYVIALFRRQKIAAALSELEMLLKIEPENPNYLVLKGTILVRKGDHEAALEIYERILKDYPDQANAQMNYGHTLKSVGRIEEAVDAYRKSIELRPTTGEAYWSLANLKTYRFSDQDLAAMLAQVTAEGEGAAEDQSHLAFALGKAYEDRREFDLSFKYYNRGNNIRSINHRYDPKRNIYDSARQIQALSTDFFAQHQNSGHDAPDPIFIVGLPRAGSTLLEQILSSHSQVEGTAELTDIIGISRQLGGKERKTGVSKYPEILKELTPEQFRELGESYIKTTQIQRSGTPFFIDKMPNNFLHIGLINLILPNAKIIDARRHPMAGCFAGFKQLFAQGQTFTYGLEKIGLYYRDYVKVMDHWDAVLPGFVHRVHYEDMIADTEVEVRKLLDFCGLEFEESCLRFYETERAIRTPSAEQVRQPIYKEGLQQWRNYEAHLAPLKNALGPILDRYPVD
ncbi:MAG: sulfotransferase [Parvibaculaceae bacterium]|nr:sulfotransferase [Parvibaculaceae bacterium]